MLVCNHCGSESIDVLINLCDRTDNLNHDILICLDCKHQGDQPEFENEEFFEELYYSQDQEGENEWPQ